MRILEIRGENLASLAGHFAIALDTAPLADAGVFAITGPTGAGKTTILDALCLALFGTAPRFAGGRGTRLKDGGQDEDEILSGDPRTILRRGAGEGFAEVEFEGISKRRLRARWEIRRARRRSTGRLQLAQMSLVDAQTGAVIAQGVSPTKQEIEREIGLSFEQFSRAVLLPQGGFAAFLKAAEGDRARILEAMTGSEIYARISREAHRRAQEETQELRAFEEARKQLRVLEPDERRALEESCEDALRSVQEAEAVVARSAAHVRFWEHARGLAAELAEAEAEIARADVAWSESAEERQTLAEIARVEPFRGSFAEADAAAEAGRVAEEALQTWENAVRSAIEERRGREAEVLEAERTLQEADATLSIAEPELRKAAHLDGQIAAAQQAVSEHESKAREAREAWSRCVETVREKRARAEAWAARGRELDRWSQERRALGILADRWDHWEALRTRSIQISEELDGARMLQQTRVRERDACAEHVGRTEAVLEKSGQARVELERALSELVTRVQTYTSPSELLSETREAEGAFRRAEQEMRLLEALIASKRRAEDAERDVARAREAVDGSLRDVRDAEDALSRASIAHETAVTLAQHARAALDLGVHRTRLRDGDPCPLCGSLEHPGFPEPIPGEEAARAIEAEVLRLAEVRDAARETLSAVRARAEVAAARLESGMEVLGNVGQALQEAEMAWRQTSGGEETLEVDARRERALLALRSAEDRLRVQRETEQARADLEQEIANLRGRLERADAERRTEESALADARRTYEKARAEAEESERKVEAAARARAELLQGLDANPEMAVIARRLLESDPSEWERQTEDARAWKARRVEREDVAGALFTLETELRADAAEQDRRRGDLDAMEMASQRQAAELAALERARVAIFEGAPTEEVHRRLRDARERAQRAWTEKREQALRAAHVEEAARERVRAAVQATEEAKVRSTHAAEGVAEALAATGIDEVRVRAWLATDVSWRQAAEQAQRVQQEARARVETVRGERRARCDAHAALRPAIEPEAALTEHEAAQAVFREADARRIEVLSRKKADDDARAQWEALGPAAQERRTRAERFLALDELLGSAEGGKLRNFAQSLTLDALVERANLRLRDLAPRYRLRRVSGQDLALEVIDLDMGEEVRGIESLSGGETFLVSLGLALALASLSSRGARLGSLFIDEGFGTLDPSALQIALATLEQLEQEGCQVGLISHVDGLAESLVAAVHVVPEGAGKSRVEVRRGAGIG